MLLCSFHHHRLDANGWEVFLKHGTPYLRPPGRLDPSRRPRRGGRAAVAGKDRRHSTRAGSAADARRDQHLVAEDEFGLR
jgi:hypothetical protein